MYCPQCGQERVSEATSFCSRCGYLLTGTAELLRLGGVLPSSAGKRSARSRGIRQGMFLFLLTFLFVPLVGILSVFLFKINPWPVGVVAFLFGMGGMLRIAYAQMFESNESLVPPAPALSSSRSSTSISALPSQHSEPARDYAAPEAARAVDLVLQPNSVTENTTKLLERDAE